MATNADVLARPVDYIQRVRALAPAFVEAQAHQEAVGELDPRLVAEMHAAGLFRMLLPAWLNGGTLDPLTYTSVVEEIARHDASSAWCVNQGSGCSMVAGNLDPAIARRVFGRPTDVLAWGPSPGARAVAVDGGYQPQLQRVLRERQPSCHLDRRALPGLRGRRQAARAGGWPQRHAGLHPAQGPGRHPQGLERRRLARHRQRLLCRQGPVRARRVHGDPRRRGDPQGNEPALSLRQHHHLLVGFRARGAGHRARLHGRFPRARRSQDTARRAQLAAR